MTTEAQDRANKANSAKSTGPSEQGKKRSRENALKHGFRAETLVTPDEAGRLPAAWKDGACVQGDTDVALARLCGVMVLRLERILITAAVTETNHRRRDYMFFDQNQTLAACRLGQDLPDNPAMVAIALERSSAGCGLASFSPSRAWTSTVATTRLRYHFLLEGTTYQGAWSWLVRASTAS